MYILFAPDKKFGILPPDHSPINDKVRFHGQLAYCPTNYLKKIHTDIGYEDITPKELIAIRKKRQLKSIVIRATGGIGDSLWAMPVCKALKEKHPYCSIAVITEAKTKQAWSQCPWINAQLDIGSWQHIGLESRADEVYDFSGIATVYKKYFNTEPVEATFDIAELEPKKEHSAYRPDIRLTVQEGKNAIAELAKFDINIDKEKLICIAVESSTSNRNWPLAHCTALARDLTFKGFKVVLIGKTKALDDKDIKEGLDKFKIVNLCGKTSLRLSWAIMSLSDCVVAMNSSPVVVATALNVPTVGLFGTHDPRIIGKHYEKFIGCFGNIDCAPCKEHWTECRHGHPAPCMRSIAYKSVFKHVLDIVKKYPRSKEHVLPTE